MNLVCAQEAEPRVAVFCAATGSDPALCVLPSQIPKLIPYKITIDQHRSRNSNPLTSLQTTGQLARGLD